MAVLWLLIVLLLSLPSIAPAQSNVDGFVAREYRSTTGTTLPYRLFIPPSSETPGRHRLVVFLHGSGGAGTDNVKQISGGNRFGTYAWIEQGIQRREPVFVLAPQAPEGEQWASVDTARLSTYGAAAVKLIEQLMKELPIDGRRIVLTGQSRGGYGTWDIAGKRPDLFAAAVPLCGGGHVMAAGKLRDVAVWAFHGLLDPAVPVKRSREMVAALRAAEANVTYTEFPDLAHAIWQRVYQDTAVINWVLRQRRP